MPIARFQMPDGRIARFEVPEGTTPEQAQAMIAESMAQQPEQAAPAAQAMPEQTDPLMRNIEQRRQALVMQPKIGPTNTQKVQASMLARGLQGMRDPIDAAAELVPNVLERATSGVGMFPNKVSEFFGSEAKRVQDINRKNEAEYQAAKSATGTQGFDAARLAGNIASPANLAIASRLPVTATTIPGLAAQGAKVGAIGGALQPVTEGDNYWATKAMQTGAGALAGGILTPIANRAASYLVRKFNQFKPQAVASLADVDNAVKEALADMNQKIEDLPAGTYEALKNKVSESLRQGKQIDPAAAMRQADFEAEGLPPLQGWITRDPMQYAKEMNLRGLDKVGEPIMQRYDLANTHLQNLMRKSAEGADTQYAAGEKLAAGLKKYDEQLRSGVTEAYKAARASAGKDMDVPLQGLAQDYAETVSNFGDKVPSGVRNQFKNLGFEGGKQLKTFTIEDADKLLKVINDNWSTDPATNKALSSLSQAVKKSVEAVDETGGPFAPAVKLASQRFRLHEAIPALEAAATGKVSPDDFVKRFVLNGKVNDVRGLAKVLDPESLQQAKAQIGETLKRAAFGENVAGDKVFSPERYAKAVRDIGDEKLSAFFSKAEIESLKRAARIGAYVNSRPNVSAVNSSNTAGALANLIGGPMQSMSRTAALVNTLAGPIRRAGEVSSALRPELPATPTKLTPDQIRILSRMLSGGAAAAGGAAGGALQ